MARSNECKCDPRFTCGYCLRDAALRNNNWTAQYQDVRPIPYTPSIEENWRNKEFEVVQELDKR